VILSRMKAYAGPNDVVCLSRGCRPPNGHGGFGTVCMEAGDLRGRGHLCSSSIPSPARRVRVAEAQLHGPIDKTKDAWGEPFLEWLRFRGYF